MGETDSLFARAFTSSSLPRLQPSLRQGFPRPCCSMSEAYAKLRASSNIKTELNGCTKLGARLSLHPSRRATKAGHIERYFVFCQPLDTGSRRYETWRDRLCCEKAVEPPGPSWERQKSSKFFIDGIGPFMGGILGLLTEKAVWEQCLLLWVFEHTEPRKAGICECYAGLLNDEDEASLPKFPHFELMAVSSMLSAVETFVTGMARLGTLYVGIAR